MRLPNAPKSVVEPEKIADYLLNPAHPDNGGKFKFFVQLGFSSEEVDVMARALMALVENNDVTSATESSHGRKYVIVGRIQSPSGKTPLVQTIWIVDKGLNTARLITAYPYKE